MAKKTNKTSHVLNLITNGNPPEPAAQPAAPVQENQPVSEAGNPLSASGQENPSGTSAAGASVTGEQAAQAAGAVQAAAGQMASVGATGSEKKVIVVDDSETNRLSDEIRDQLISHLEAEEKQAREKAGAAERDTANAEPIEPMSEPIVEAATEAPAAQQETEIIAEAKVEAAVSQQETEVIAETPVEAPAESVSASSSEPQGAPVSQQETETIAETPVEVPAESVSASTSESQEAPVAQQETETIAEAKVEAPAAEPQPVSEQVKAQEELAPEPEYQMVNVMERILKRYKLEDQMKRYGVCMCSRCKADVEALALTKLPSKYVVVDSSSAALIIGFYENRFRVNVLTQVIKACMQVKENPHHK